MRRHPSSWTKTLAKLGFRRTWDGTRLRPDSRRRFSRIEQLEARQMLSVTVDTLVDVVDPNDGVTSLREAIVSAPSSGSQVVFHSSLEGGVITLNGQLTLNQSISILGPGASELTVQAAPSAGRVFHVASNSASVTISGLTVTGGSGDHGASTAQTDRSVLWE